MLKKDLPRFLVYQPNKQEFHICLEVNEKFIRWSSNYAPTLNVDFPREVNRIEDMPIKDAQKSKSSMKALTP